MRPQVLSALLTTVLGAGAMFTLYTYLSGTTKYYPRNTSVRHGNAGADWCPDSLSVTISAANWQIVQLTAR